MAQNICNFCGEKIVRNSTEIFALDPDKNGKYIERKFFYHPQCATLQSKEITGDSKKQKRKELMNAFIGAVFYIIGLCIGLLIILGIIYIVRKIT